MNLTIRRLKRKRKRVRKMPQYFQSERVKYLKAITAHIKQLQNLNEKALTEKGLFRKIDQSVKFGKSKEYYKAGVLSKKLRNELKHQHVKHRKDV